MKKRTLLLVTLLFVLPYCPLLACGSLVIHSYLYGEPESTVLQIPRVYFESELAQIAGMQPANPYQWGVPWENTLAKDVGDLKDALEKQGVEKDRVKEVAKIYHELRERMNREYNTRGKRAIAGGPSGALEYEEFDFQNYAEVMEAVPAEFSLYARAANSYKAGNTEKALAQWREILSLPKGERPYRSTWAAFMIGKVAMAKKNHKEAVRAFEQTRSLAAEGYADSLGLATDALGWQAAVEIRRKNYQKAMNLYYECYQKGSNRQRYTAAESLKVVCSRTIRMMSKEKKNVWDAWTVEDPLARQILAIYIASFQDKAWKKQLPQGINWPDYLLEGKQTIDGAQAARLAWGAYASGDVTWAKKWLDVADVPTSKGRWLRSKLLLRDGKVEEALAILREIGKGNRRVQIDLGILLLAQKKDIAALDAFIRAEAWKEAEFIAEVRLPTKDIEQYLNRPPSGVYISPSIRNILSRRLAREEKWDKALVYSSSRLRPVLENYADTIRSARNAALPERERAKRYMEAAQVAFDHGLDIMGKIRAREWEHYRRSGRGKAQPSHENPAQYHRLAIPDASSSDVKNKLKNVLASYKKEMPQVEKSAPVHDRRFAYDFLAADLMWEASLLLPDNDILTAKALYHGGDFVKKREPEYADKFYKALVKRCGKLPFAQEAEKLQGFPSDPPE